MAAKEKRPAPTGGEGRLTEREFPLAPVGQGARSDHFRGAVTSSTNSSKKPREDIRKKI
jgi:hypothetical protein